MKVITIEVLRIRLPETRSIPVEVEKPAKERGYYLHYEEYNQPIEKSVEAVKNHDLLKE